MVNPNNALENWNIDVSMEINHEKGLAIAKIMQGDKLLKSMRFIQGYHVDETGKFMSHDDIEAMKWLLRLLENSKG